MPGVYRYVLVGYVWYITHRCHKKSIVCMRIQVEHLDNIGNFDNLSYDLNYLQFIKHLAFAGMGVSKSIYNTFRFAGLMFEYFPYWKRAPYNFWIPEIVNHDPTELGQISNRIGKALADFLAKKIYGAQYTHNYEDAMVQYGYPIKGSRPDLYCDTLSKQFAIEVKGYKRSSVSMKQMNGYKSQSREGPVPIHFSIASVAFNLYEKPRVKFYDPVGKDFEYSKEINRKLMSLYYQSILDNLKQLNKEPELKIANIPNGFLAFQLLRVFMDENLYLLIHKSIGEQVWFDSYEYMNSFTVEEKNIYIDVDGIGLCII